MKYSKIFLISSVFLFFSCASTNKVQETNPENVKENPAQQEIESEQPQTPILNENPVQNENETLEQNTDADELSEKIKTDELLNETVPQESENYDFVEPPVFDAPIEEQTQNEENKLNEKIDEEELNKDEDVLIQNEQTNADNSAEKTDSSNENTLSENQENIPIDEELSSSDAEDNINTQADSSIQGENENLDNQNNEELKTEIENQNPDENPETTENTEPVKIQTSRSMTCKNNQYVEISYPGSGWVYLGEDSEQTKFRYFGRKLGTQNTVFTLRSIKDGKSILHFYKNDVLTGSYIDDYLEIEVLNENAKPSEKAIAPLYEDYVPKKPVRKTNIQDNILQSEENPEQNNNSSAIKNENTVQKNADSNQTETLIDSESDVETIIKTEENNETFSPQSSLNDEQKNQAEEIQNNSLNSLIEENAESSTEKTENSNFLEKAKNSLKNKEYKKALEEIDFYLERENSKLDEAYFVKASILESESEVKNIKESLNCYEKILDSFPASVYWNEANRRKIFLNRFYF